MAFEWNMKVLPFVTDWFDKALGCDMIDEVQVGARKISAICQFIHAMPELLEAALHPPSQPSSRRSNGSTMREHKHQRMASSDS